MDALFFMQNAIVAEAVGHPPQHTVNLETSSSYNHDIYYNMTIKGIIKIYIYI